MALVHPGSMLTLGAIDLEQDEAAILEFINGVTIGNLLYIVDALRTQVTDKMSPCSFSSASTSASPLSSSRVAWL